MVLRWSQSLLKNVYAVHRLDFSTSSCYRNKWRSMQGLEPNPNRYGPIKLLPDYSFVDGRPVPLSYRKVREAEHQQKLCQKIKELSHELDYGLQQYYENQEQKKKEREAIIQSKLKPKGVALLKKNKDLK